MSDKKLELQPLNCDMDANRWASEFMTLIKDKHKDVAIDFDLMRAWFANAIMCGWDNANWKLKKNQTQSAQTYNHTIESKSE